MQGAATSVLHARHCLCHRRHDPWHEHGDEREPFGDADPRPYHAGGLGDFGGIRLFLSSVSGDQRFQTGARALLASSESVGSCLVVSLYSCSVAIRQLELDDRRCVDLVSSAGMLLFAYIRTPCYLEGVMFIPSFDLLAAASALTMTFLVYRWRLAEAGAEDRDGGAWLCPGAGCGRGHRRFWRGHAEPLAFGAARHRAQHCGGAGRCHRGHRNCSSGGAASRARPA